MNYLLIFLGCLSMFSSSGKPKDGEHPTEVVERLQVPANQAAAPAHGQGAGNGLVIDENAAGPKDSGKDDISEDTTTAQIAVSGISAVSNTPSGPDSKSAGGFDNNSETHEKLSGVSLQLADHTAWNSMLAQYVDGAGNVDYTSFSRDREGLDDYLDYLAGREPAESAGKNEKLAYYINLYNAATVQLILDNYPVNSIRDINSPWDKKRVKSGGRMVSLGDIEHKILRKMGEPRIHFAINCASYSCPKLINQAFTADLMETQLQEAATGFIRDTSKNQISKTSLQLSNIFNWYKKDFTENGTLIEYLDKFTEAPISPDAKIKFMDYDWNLNDAE